MDIVVAVDRILFVIRSGVVSAPVVKSVFMLRGLRLAYLKYKLLGKVVSEALQLDQMHREVLYK